MSDEPVTGEAGRPVTIPEVHHLLDKENKERAELSYEQRLALEHAQLLDRINGVTKAKQLYKELLKIERVTPLSAAKIVDSCPRFADEVEVIFAKERQPLSKEDVDTIISTVSTYLA
jgi:DNA-directed RNA polymerase subunit F